MFKTKFLTQSLCAISLLGVAAPIIPNITTNIQAVSFATSSDQTGSLALSPKHHVNFSGTYSDGAKISNNAISHNGQTAAFTNRGFATLGKTTYFKDGSILTDGVLKQPGKSAVHINYDGEKTFRDGTVITNNIAFFSDGLVINFNNVDQKTLNTYEIQHDKSNNTVTRENYIYNLKNGTEKYNGKSYAAVKDSDSFKGDKTFDESANSTTSGVSTKDSDSNSQPTQDNDDTTKQTGKINVSFLSENQQTIKPAILLEGQAGQYDQQLADTIDENRTINYDNKTYKLKEMDVDGQKVLDFDTSNNDDANSNNNDSTDSTDSTDPTDTSGNTNNSSQNGDSTTPDSDQQTNSSGKSSNSNNSSNSSVNYDSSDNSPDNETKPDLDNSNSTNSSSDSINNSNGQNKNSQNDSSNTDTTSDMNDSSNSQKENKSQNTDTSTSDELATIKDQLKYDPVKTKQVKLIYTDSNGEDANQNGDSLPDTSTAKESNLQLLGSFLNHQSLIKAIEKIFLNK